nr:universal stress protein [Ardenticatena sp.]
MNAPRRHQRAIDEFRRARRKAALEQLLARFRGQTSNLLPYEQVRDALQLDESFGRSLGLQEIPLDAIVGSVGRYTDFTRSFLPLHDSMADRWAHVHVATEGEMLPIDVYKVGDIYFVIDGNHRVSVARERGDTTIQAYVTEVPSPITLTPNMDIDDVLLAAEQANFYRQTGLQERYPNIDIRLTAPGRYRDLLHQIAMEQERLRTETGRDVSFEEAADVWYRTVYQPMADAIRRLGLLDEFPTRTEADLFVWLVRHRNALETALGWEIPPEVAVLDWLEETRESGLAAQEALWTTETALPKEADHLFNRILVPLDGSPHGWAALDEALDIARREKARLFGLHIVPVAVRAVSPKVQAIEETFLRRCAQHQVEGFFAVDVGTHPAKRILARARLVDLVVVGVNVPLPSAIMQKQRHGLHLLLAQSVRPLLVVPRKAYPPTHALIAYNGSTRAEAALALGVYMVRQWQTTLTVLTADVGGRVSSAQQQARTYLEARGIQATFVRSSLVPEKAITKTAEQLGCSLIVMGGYGSRLEAVLDSTVNRVLRRTTIPVFVCR